VIAFATPAPAATLSGYVHNAANGEAIDYATVLLQGTGHGAITNAKGFYSIPRIPAGSYTLAFRCTGYATQAQEITLAENESRAITVELEPEAIVVAPVEVKAEPKSQAIEPSLLTLRTRELASVPKMVEPDLFRAVQALPGVSTLSDYSSGLYVRGGSPDQNLILLDDVDVYNPSHLFGFFSTFNVDAVKTVDLQKGGFPARYGGRLSSLLDVHNRDGNRKEFQGVGRLSLLSTCLTLEGPWRRGSWMASGRRTYLSTLAKAADIDLPYYFYDVHGKLNYDFWSGDRASFSVFRGLDRLDLSQNTVDVLLAWGNDTWSTSWTHVFNHRLFSHFLLGGSRFHSDGEVAFQDFEMAFRTRIRDLSAKGALSIKPTPSHLVDFGFEGKLLDFDWSQRIGEGSRLAFGYDGFYGAVYGQDRWDAGERWRIQPGLRLDFYSKGDYFGLGPRLSLRRQLDPMTAVHATYGRYHQFLNLVSSEGFSAADMWFPVDETLRPGRADHYILGAEYGPFERFDLSVEAYVKDYRNLVEFSAEYTRSLLDEDARLGDLFNSGTGIAYGADVYLRNRLARCEGWIGYSLGWARRHVERFNRGEEYTPTYDRRHQLTLMQSCPLTEKWTLDFSFRYGSGQPTTLAAGRYVARDENGREHHVILPGKLNEARLPFFSRVDVGVAYRTRWRGARIEPNLQIINVYNRKNVYLRAYDLTTNPATYDDVGMLPFLPTVGINVFF
jgi:hypothetical protein